MAKYKKYEINETIYSVIKINDDWSALQVSLFRDRPSIELFDEALNAWSDYVETTREEFVNFYQKTNTMIINSILS